MLLMNGATSLSDDIERAAELLAGAEALLVAAGAGMGVDSGLPDFRGRDGFWKAYPALARAGLDFTQIASPRAFVQDPQLAWGFYGHRLALYRATRPHAGFALLRQWGERMRHGAQVFTSNVDGQFQRAGFDEAAVHECHGSLMHLQCSQPCSEAVWRADAFMPEVDEATCRLLNPPPRCPACDALARPALLMFGDWAWSDARSSRQRRRLEAWLRQARRLLVIEIGAGLAIPSVRRFSETMVLQQGARLIRINPREPQVAGRLDVGLPLPALQALQALHERRR